MVVHGQDGWDVDVADRFRTKRTGGNRPEAVETIDNHPDLGNGSRGRRTSRTRRRADGDLPFGSAGQVARDDEPTGDSFSCPNSTDEQPRVWKGTELVDWGGELMKSQKQRSVIEKEC